MNNLLKGLATSSTILRESVLLLDKLPKNNEASALIQLCVLIVLFSTFIIIMYIIYRIVWWLVIERILYYSLRSWKQKRCMQRAKERVYKRYSTVMDKNHIFTQDVMEEYKKMMGIHIKKKL